MTHLEEVQEAARWWYAKGITPIPYTLGSNLMQDCPINYKMLGGVLPSCDIVDWWFSRDCNIALLPSGKYGLFALDFDDMAIYSEWAKTYPQLSTSYSVVTNRGRHVYFSAHGYSMKESFGAYMGIDVITSWPIVTAPSVHPKGTQYRVVDKDASIIEVPTIFDSYYRFVLKKNGGDWYMPKELEAFASRIVETCGPCGLGSRRPWDGVIENGSKLEPWAREIWMAAHGITDEHVGNVKRDGNMGSGPGKYYGRTISGEGL